MEDRRINVLLLGQSRSAEMQTVVGALDDYAPTASVHRADDMTKSLRPADNESWFPDFVVVFQQWPDEYCVADVDRLLHQFSLARLICCFGAWCESDGRNRDIWPPATRIFARTARGRIRRELAVLQGELDPLPMTASREEVFSFDSGTVRSQTDAVGDVVVVSPDIEFRRYLEELLRWAGYGIVTGESRARAVAVVWDADPLRPEASAELREICRHHPRAAVAVLANLAYPEDVERLVACGADTVVAKLTSAVELLQAIDTAVRCRRSACA